jgi:Leucine-rich repeat (LRR) protein
MLQLKNNRLATIDALEHLLTLKQLTSLDLTGNRVEDGEGLLDLLSQMPNLKSLHLTGNPCVRTIKNYRKTVVSRIPALMYLDEKPVFADERRLVNAWAAGGLEAEREEKKKMREEEQAAILRRLEEFRDLQRRARGEATASGTEQEENDSDSSGPGSGDGSDDGDVWVPGGPATNTSASQQQSASGRTSNADASDVSSVAALD